MAGAGMAWRSLMAPTGNGPLFPSPKEDALATARLGGWTRAARHIEGPRLYLHEYSCPGMGMGNVPFVKGSVLIRQKTTRTEYVSFAPSNMLNRGSAYWVPKVLHAQNMHVLPCAVPRYLIRYLMTLIRLSLWTVSRRAPFAFLHVDVYISTNSLALLTSACTHRTFIKRSYSN